MKKLSNQSLVYNVSMEEKIELNAGGLNVSDLKEEILTDASVTEKDRKIKLQNKVDSLTDELNTAKQIIVNQEKERKDLEKEILELESELAKSRKKETIIISLLSAFMYNHPKGVSMENICSKINSSELIPTVCADEIENIMRRHANLFEAIERESDQIEATQEKKWKCISVSQETLEELQKSKLILDTPHLHFSGMETEELDLVRTDPATSNPERFHNAI